MVAPVGIKGDGPWSLAVMWLLASLVFFFLILRFYTRVVCLASYGLDDHVYLVAFIFLLIFTIFTTLAGNYGFGQTMEEIGSMDAVVQATLYECIGQGFAIVGMAIAKASLGFFLLRLVTITWHRIAIWSAMTLVMLASIGRLDPQFRFRVSILTPSSPSPLLLALLRPTRFCLRPPHPRRLLPHRHPADVVHPLQYVAPSPTLMQYANRGQNSFHHLGRLLLCHLPLDHCVAA